jgi:hypothetical protein
VTPTAQSTPHPGATGFAGSLAGTARAKAAVNCQRALLKAGAQVVGARLTKLGSCGRAVHRCIQTAPDDPACLGKASARCRSAIAGFAGGVFAWYVSVFYPETVFSGDFTVFAIVFALFGGTATVVGPILGVVILYGIYNAVGITTPQYFQLIYGVLIMGIVLFLPEGLVSLLRRWGINVP